MWKNASTRLDGHGRVTFLCAAARTDVLQRVSPQVLTTAQPAKTSPSGAQPFA